MGGENSLLRGGHTALFIPLTSIHTHANASDQKRKPVWKVSHFAAFQCSNLVNSGLRIRITWYRVINRYVTAWPRIWIKRTNLKLQHSVCFGLNLFFLKRRCTGWRPRYHDRCSMQNDFACSKSSVTAPLCLNKMYPNACEKMSAFNGAN